MSIRNDFPILQRQSRGQPLVYLDNAATTQKPQVVIDAISDYYQDYNANVHRAAHELAEQATTGMEETRDLVRAFINAQQSAEVIFTRGTTEAINLVANILSTHIQPGQDIVITELEHHSNIVPWQMLAGRIGANLRAIAIHDSGDIDLDDAATKITSNCALVAFSHVSNGLGCINPAEQIISLAKTVGALTLVDGAQAALHLTVDVQALDCDFYVFSGHKIFAPTGIGVLYGRYQLLEQLPPWQGGGAMIEKVEFARSTYAPPPQRFEAGTPMITEAIALHAAIDYVAEQGPDRLFAHEAALAKTLREELRTLNSVTLFGPEESAGIVSFAIEGVHPHDLGTILDEEDVAIRAGHHCAQPLMEHLGVPATARASFGLYSDDSDIAALLRGIDRTLKIFA